MSQAIGGLTRNIAAQQQQNVGGPEARSGAPAELQGAHASPLRTFGRILAGIFTLGISEGIRAIIRHVKAGEAPAPRDPAADLPPAPPRADIFNKSIASEFQANNLPPDFKAAVTEAFDRMEARFGEDMFPKDSKLRTSPQTSLGFEVKDALRQTDEAITPQAFSALVEKKATYALLHNVMTTHVTDLCARIGYQKSPSLLAGNFLGGNPEIIAAMDNITDKASLDHFMATTLQRLEASVRHNHELHVSKTQAQTDAIQTFSRQTGLSEDTVRQRINLGDLDNRFTYLSVDILDGKRPLAGQEMRDAFTQVAKTFAERKAALYTSVDTLDLPPDIRNSWKDSVLTQNTLTKGDLFTTWYGISRGVAVSESILPALNDGVGDRELLGMLEVLGTQVRDAVMAHYGQEGWAELGGDGQSDALFYTGQATLAAHDELRQALMDRPELVDRLYQMAGDDVAQGFSSNTLAAAELRCGAQGAMLLLNSVQRTE